MAFHSQEFYDSSLTLETLDKKDVYYIFPPLMPNTSTRVVLKKPKTDSSIRKLWLPKTLAYILREWKKHQYELKELLEEEYTDYNLVVALNNGRPCESRVLLKAFEALREKAEIKIPHNHRKLSKYAVLVTPPTGVEPMTKSVVFHIFYMFL